ncbi:MAG: hypothetical protein OJF48_000971 [Afipia sp.]|nr:MAG: hypothetical protein OJF48_000971 [Afipia sp.]
MPTKKYERFQYFNDFEAVTWVGNNLLLTMLPRQIFPT